MPAIILCKGLVHGFDVQGPFLGLCFNLYGVGMIGVPVRASGECYGCWVLFV